MTKITIVFILLTGLVASCIPETEILSVKELPDDVQVQVILNNWRLHIETGQIQDVMDMVKEDYLNQGRQKADINAWAIELSEHQYPFIDFHQLVIDVKGDRATASYLLKVRGCDGPQCQPCDGDECPACVPPHCVTVLQCKSLDTVRCGWLRHLQRIGSTWKFTGDQLPWGLDFSFQATRDGLGLAGAIYDPRSTLSEVHVSWFGLDQTVTLVQQAGYYWRLPEGTLVPQAIYPDHPLPWELDITLQEGNALTITFYTIMDSFATSLFPNGEALPPFDFSWITPDKGDGGARVEVLMDAQVLWRSAITHEEFLSYAGPALMEGASYEYRVHVFDTTGNSSIASGAIIPLSAETITPRIASISPQTGSSSGGDEMIITGSGFLTGMRVLFGIAKALEVTLVSSESIECLSPALESGVYNVLVINPSGKVGMLERAFLVP